MFGMGMPEMIFIFLAALVIFGPRKLPEIGRTLGKAMGQFRQASNEFRSAWEAEVERETAKKSPSPEPIHTPEPDQSLFPTQSEHLASELTDSQPVSETGEPHPAPLFTPIEEHEEGTISRGHRMKSFASTSTPAPINPNAYSKGRSGPALEGYEG